MESREMESKLLLTKSILEGDNDLVKEILRKIRADEQNSWNVQLNRHLREADMSWEELKNLGKTGIKRKVRKSDSGKWERKMATYRTVGLHREYKKEIKEEDI